MKTRRLRCETVREWLAAYLEGDLDARHSLEIEVHLEGCPPCRGVLAGWQAALSDLRAARPERESPPDLLDEFRASLPQRVTGRCFVWAWAAGMAATVLLAGGLSFLCRKPVVGPESPVTRMANSAPAPMKVHPISPVPQKTMRKTQDFRLIEIRKGDGGRPDGSPLRNGRMPVGATRWAALPSESPQTYKIRDLPQKPRGTRRKKYDTASTEKAIVAYVPPPARISSLIGKGRIAAFTHRQAEEDAEGAVIREPSYILISVEPDSANALPSIWPSVQPAEDQPQESSLVLAHTDRNGQRRILSIVKSYTNQDEQMQQPILQQEPVTADTGGGKDENRQN